MLSDGGPAQPADASAGAADSDSTPGTQAINGQPREFEFGCSLAAGDSRRLTVDAVHPPRPRAWEETARAG